MIKYKKILLLLATAVFIACSATGCSKAELEEPDQTENQTENQTEKPVEPVEATQFFRLTHSANDFTVPTIGGEGAWAKVKWDENGELAEWQKDELHHYDVEGAHIIEIQGSKISTIVIPSIGSITEFDVSRF